jgi:hypothetical protein
MRLINTSLENCKIYFVNLKERTDRKENLENQFKKLGINNYKRIDAVYGKKLPLKDQNYWMDKHNFFRMGSDKGKVLARVGCLLSHLNTLKTAIKKYDNNPVVIIEDDIEFLVDGKYKFSYPEDCDMCYLGGLYWYSDENDLIPLNNYKDSLIRIDPRQLRIAGTFGYMIPNLQKLKMIYDKIVSTYKRNIDVMYIRQIQSLGNCYLINPPLINHGDYGSDIANTDSNPSKLYFGHIFNCFGAYWTKLRINKQLKKYKKIDIGNNLESLLSTDIKLLNLLPNNEIKKSLSNLIEKNKIDINIPIKEQKHILGYYYFNGLANYLYNFLRKKFKVFELDTNQYKHLLTLIKKYNSISKIKDKDILLGIKIAQEYFLN